MATSKSSQGSLNSTINNNNQSSRNKEDLSALKLKVAEVCILKNVFLIVEFGFFFVV